MFCTYEVAWTLVSPLALGAESEMRFLSLHVKLMSVNQKKKNLRP